MRISDWSSDVCSSDLIVPAARRRRRLLRLVTSRLLGTGGFVRSLGRELDGVVGVLGGGADRQRADVVHVAGGDHQIGRATCRARVCPYVAVTVVAVSFKNEHL